MSITYSLILKTHKNIFDNGKVVAEEFDLYLTSINFNLVKKRERENYIYFGHFSYPLKRTQNY